MGDRKSGFFRDSFPGKLTALVIPIAFQNLMSAAVSASDAVMLGVLNQESLAAVSLAAQIQFVFSLFMAALTIGTTILAAQYWGKGDREAIEKILGIVLKYSAGTAVLFFLAAACVPVLLMQLFTSDPVLIAGGSRYLRIAGLSYICSGISQVCLCIMKNSGKTLKSAVIGSSSMVLNILFNAVLIFGFAGIPGLGIEGAAIATVIARGIEMIWALAESARAGSIHVRFRYLIYSDQLLKADFMKYTLPVLGNELVWGCGFTMYSVIMGHLDSDAVAANAIANIVKNLIACVCLGIASGGSIIVGNELGRGSVEKAKEYGGRLCRAAVASGVISGLLLLAFSPLIIRVTALTAQAQGYLKGMLIICSYYMIGKSVNSTAIAGIFCAGGDSGFGLICDAVTMWAITVPFGFLAAFYWRLPVLAVYVIISLDELVKLPAVYRHYKKYRWIQDLTRREGVL